MTCPFYLVDAFAGEPFSGNTAGVCLLEGPAEESWMQSVAAEINQAETAFLWPLDRGAWSLRWFTPTVEVDLCGHATLAAARVLEAGSQRFHTRSGLLCTDREGDMVTMDFPSEMPHEAPIPLALDGAIWTGRNRMDWFVVLESEMAVRAYTPDLGAIARLDGRGLCITALADGISGPTLQNVSVDFVSRFFAPQSGVPEDSVTGSTHCALCPLWSGRLGKQVLTGYQASPRGGLVRTESKGSRVLLGGKAWIVVSGKLEA